MKRFLREARCASRVVHPNVIDVLDMGRDEETGALFIVQELLRGRDLAAEVSRRPLSRLDASECVAWLTPIAEALEAAHARGVVHRDVTPGNVFLARTGASITPKLIDFGVAAHLRGTARDSANIAGTVAYMAPEHARSGTIEPRIDVWSLGVLFYRCLTGVLPYETGDASKLVELVRRERLVPVDQRADVPTELATIVHRALDPDPARRFPSMSAFADALGRTAQQRSTIPPHSTIRPIARLARVRFGMVLPPEGDLRDAVAEIARRARSRLAVVPFDSHANVVDALAEGLVDLAWLPPVAYVRAERLGAVRAMLTVARDAQQSYSAALVVRSDSRARRLEDLVGARAAWVHPWSTAGYLIPRRMLRAASLEPDLVLRAQSFVGSRAEVARALLAGEADVGAFGVHAGDLGSEGLRVVASSSEPLPEDAVCASTHLRESRAGELVQHLMDVVGTPELASALRVATRGGSFVAADPSKYRELGAALAEDLGPR